MASNHLEIDSSGCLIIPQHIVRCRVEERDEEGRLLSSQPCWAGVEPAAGSGKKWTPEDVVALRAKLCDDCRTRLDAADLLAEPPLPALPPVTTTSASSAAEV